MQALSNVVDVGKKRLKIKLRERKLSTKLFNSTIYCYEAGEILITVIEVKSGILKHNKENPGAFNCPRLKKDSNKFQ